MAISKASTSEKWVLMTELNGEALLHHFKFSSHGQVVRIKKGMGIEEEFIPKTINGYKFMSFTTREGSRITIYLHRLIAEFYVTQPSEGITNFVIHLDGDRQTIPRPAHAAYLAVSRMPLPTHHLVSNSRGAPHPAP